MTDGEKLKSGEIRISMPRAERAPGTEGIWTFVFIDMAIFLLIFFVFMSERLGHYDLYKASQSRLNEYFGLANTLILLTSSWLVVEAIKRAKMQRPTEVFWRLGLAFLLGAAFVVDKIIEYYIEISQGVSINGNSFFTFYFFITFVHFLHVLSGMIFLSVYTAASKDCTHSEKYVIGLENVGLFWHYVDILWVFIFPLLYLI